MLTIRTVTSDNAELVDYYENDEAFIDTQERYYTDSGVISETDEMTCAVWHGKAAEELGLSGHASREDFVTLSRGTKPGTDERIRGLKQDEETKERHGHDLVFSAPKSYSMALEVGGDLRLFDAHMSAVKETMDLAEKMFGNTRIWVNGVREVVNTGNLAMALIPHHTSRDGDPNLHTHVYVMNGTKGPDGKWRSLSHEELVHAKWLGSHYRQKLAENAHALGYRTYPTKDGFELQGYERNQIEVFSKRHKAIEQKVIQMGLDLTPENKKKAVLTTRKAKRDSGKKLEDTQEVWREEGKPYGIGTLTLQSPIVLQVEPGLMKRELESAIAHFSERSVAFNQQDIYQYVFEHVKVSKIQAQDLDAEIQKHTSLIKTIHPGQYTTVEAFEREIETRNLWMAGQGKAEALKPEANLEGSSLNSGQAEVVLQTLTSTDTHQVWHGFSGVGKTTAFRTLKAELEETGVVIRGYATTLSAAEGLQKELGIKTNTVQHLVLNQPDSVPNQLWLVDEVGMLGAEDMLKMQRQAEAVGARIIIAGDAGQNSSIKAGSPLRSLMGYGATTHKLNKIIRQQNSIQLQAVELIANGDGSAALNLLNNNGYIKEIEDRGERATAISGQFLALSQREQDKTFIVTGTNAERLSITQALRQGLKEQGKLSEAVKTVQLVSRQFTAEQSRRIENYTPGDYIKLRIKYPGTELQKGQLYKVEKRDGNELLVSSFGGRIYRLDPARHQEKDVYYAKNIELAVGDKLRWTASDKQKARTNGRHLTVASINDTTMTVKDVNTKKTQEVSLLEPLPVDYDWVSTSYRAQGRTVKRVIVSTTSDPTASREPFYVKISRQEQELSVYTQDLQKLKEWVSHSNAQENALDLIGEPDGNRSISRDQTTARTSPSPEPGTIGAEPGTTGAEPRTEILDEQRTEHSADYSQGRDGRFSNPVRRTIGDPQTFGDSGRDSGVIGDSQGIERPSDQLGANSRGYDRSNELRRRRDQEPISENSQQRMDEGASDLNRRIDRVIASLDRLADDDLVRESGLVQSTREVVDALEPIVSSLEGQTAPAQPKPDLATAMERAIAALTQADSEQVFSDSTIIDEIKGLVERVEAQTIVQEQLSNPAGVQHDPIISIEPNARINESERSHSDLADLHQLAQSEGGRDRERVRTPSQGIDDRATQIARSIAERLSGAINVGNVEEAIGELARNCGEINTDDERVRDPHERRARIEPALSQLTQSVHRLHQQLNQAIKRERVDTIAGAIAEWRTEQQLGQTLSQFNEVINRLGVDVSQPKAIANDLAKAIVQNNAEAELEMAMVSLTQMLEQSQTQVMARPEIQQLSDAITELQSEQTLVQALTQFNAVIESAQAVTKPSIAEALAQAIGDQAIEDTLVQNLTQFKEASTQANAPVTVKILAQVIANNNLESELVENFQRLDTLLTQTNAQANPKIGQLATLINEWRAEGDLTQAIAQFTTFMQSVSQTQAPVTADVLAQVIVTGSIEADLEATLLNFNEVLRQPQTKAEVVQLANLLAEKLLERRAEDVLNEHLVAFSDATEAVLSELRQRPELTQLVEMAQMLRSNPTLNEGETGQQLRELTQAVQALNLEMNTPDPSESLNLISKPKKPEVFWVPDYSKAQRPDHIEPHHWEEMTRSAIHPVLIALNVQSLEGEAVHDRLLSERLATMGTGQYVTQPMARLMAQYESLTQGGWWGTAGVDARSLANLQPGQTPSLSDWGCFKGDNPRIDQDKTERKGETQVIKYENPAGAERHLYLPIVPEDIAQKIYDKRGIQPTAAERKNGFWSVVANHPEIPIAITEGLKKTLASLSQGEVTIGCAGVNALYRARDEDKQKLPERLLNDEVAIFATPGRSFTFAFDRDAKTSTVFNVRRELVRGVELLENQGCECKIAKWKPEQKGLDDLIVNQGAQAYAKAIATTQPTDQEKRTYYRTEYNAIARQVRANDPEATPEQLDAEVYLRAITKSDPKDGERFISQSDHARSLNTPEQVAAYIEQVKANAPLYRQQQRALEAAQVAQQQQQQRDRAEYVAIAQQVRDEWGNVSAERVDIEVFSKAGKNGDRLLAQSDRALSLTNSEQVKQYIEIVREKASQSQEEKALYKRFASGIQQIQGSMIPYRLDLEVQFQAKRSNVQATERLLTHSDVTKAFYKEDPIKAQRYIKALEELAAMYKGLRESPNQEAVNQSIPKLVRRKLIDPEAMRRLREEEELHRQQQGLERGVDGPLL
jgi:conjugative relaxase-like TrwC/TraI family protein